MVYLIPCFRYWIRWVILWTCCNPDILTHFREIETNPNKGFALYLLLKTVLEHFTMTNIKSKIRTFCKFGSISVLMAEGGVIKNSWAEVDTAKSLLIFLCTMKPDIPWWLPVSIQDVHILMYYEKSDIPWWLTASIYSRCQEHLD